MKIGYARVSTNDQNLENQIELLNEAGYMKIYKEKISGAKKTRPELQQLLENIRESDILVVCKLDRLPRVQLFDLKVQQRALAESKLQQSRSRSKLKSENCA